MNVFIVYAHPEPKSFNGAMASAATAFMESKGHQVVASDLYKMEFDPISDRRNFKSVKDHSYFKQQHEELHASTNNGFSAEIIREIEKLEWCDVLLMQFPLWWAGMPAILKGWADRVLVMGRVYGAGKIYDDGAFKGKRAMLSITTGGPEERFRPGGLSGDIRKILFPINHGILRFTGFDVLHPFIAYGPAHLDHVARKTYIDAFLKRLEKIETDELIKYASIRDFES